MKANLPSIAIGANAAKAKSDGYEVREYFYQLLKTAPKYNLYMDQFAGNSCVQLKQQREVV